MCGSESGDLVAMVEGAKASADAGSAGSSVVARAG